MIDYTIVHQPEILLMGIECRTSNAPDAGPQDIPKHWAKFYGDNILDQIPNKSSDEVIALYCDYESDYTGPYSFVIGCPVTSVDDLPEGMIVKIIPTASYAVFYAIGEYPKSLIDTWGAIWHTPLDRTYTGDFEIYGNKFVAGSPQEVEVYIAIEDRAEK